MAIEVGSKLQGKVTGITHFGAFVELSAGVTGLIHISEIADNYVRDVKEHLKLGDIVTVKVVNVDKEGKIGLSIRQAVDKPVEERPAARPPRDPERNNRRPDRNDRGGRFARPSGKLSFEEQMSRFLKDSEEKMSSLKKNTEGKRGGRGARRV